MKINFWEDLYIHNHLIKKGDKKHAYKVLIGKAEQVRKSAEILLALKKVENRCVIIYIF